MTTETTKFITLLVAMSSLGFVMSVTGDWMVVLATVLHGICGVVYGWLK